MIGNPRVQRAHLLMERRRYDDAARELRGALVEDPDDNIVHGLLSLCLQEQEKHDEALESARAAVRGAPERSFGYYALANAHFRKDDYGPAREAIMHAIRLEPDNASSWATLAAIHLDQKQWTEGLKAAERGLQFDPENVQCNNLRAMALVGLGRREEADATIRDALEKEPENATSHANIGWTCLHRGDHKAALEHFREALRLEPDMEWARQGLVQALKSRYLVYRLLLAYFLWSSRLGKAGSWGVVIGGYLAFRLLRWSAQEFPQAQVVLVPLVFLVAIAFLMTWIGSPLFDLLLRLNPYGRYALNREEKRVSNWLALLLVAAAVLGVVFWVTRVKVAGVAALITALMVIPVTHALRVDEERRGMFLGLTAALAATGGLTLLAVALNWPARGGLSVLFILGFIGYQILAIRTAIHR